jgi:hypothetical protein
MPVHRHDWFVCYLLTSYKLHVLLGWTERRLWVMNCKGCEKKQPWPTLRHCHRISPVGLRKTTKILSHSHLPGSNSNPDMKNTVAAFACEHEITQYNRAPLEKLTVAQLLKKHEDPLQCSEKPTTGHYSDPDRPNSSPYPHIYTASYMWCLPFRSSNQNYACSFTPYCMPCQSNPSWSDQFNIWLKGTNYDVPLRYKKFPSAPYSQIPYT